MGPNYRLDARRTPRIRKREERGGPGDPDPDPYPESRRVSTTYLVFLTFVKGRGVRL